MTIMQYVEILNNLNLLHQADWYQNLLGKSRFLNKLQEDYTGRKLHYLKKIIQQDF